MNPIARSLMAKYDKRTDEINSSASKYVPNKDTIKWSYFSNIDQLNNCPKRTKLIKKTGDQRSYAEYVKSL